MKFVQSETALTPESRIIHYKYGQFEVSASRHAVVLRGELALTTSDDLEVLALHIAMAWKHHGRMKNETVE